MQNRHTLFSPPYITGGGAWEGYAKSLSFFVAYYGPLWFGLLKYQTELKPSLDVANGQKLALWVEECLRTGQVAPWWSSGFIGCPVPWRGGGVVAITEEVGGVKVVGHWWWQVGTMRGIWLLACWTPGLIGIMNSYPLCKAYSIPAHFIWMFIPYIRHTLPDCSDTTSLWICILITLLRHTLSLLHT